MGVKIDSSEVDSNSVLGYGFGRVVFVIEELMFDEEDDDDDRFSFISIISIVKVFVENDKNKDNMKYGCLN